MISFCTLLIYNYQPLGNIQASLRDRVAFQFLGDRQHSCLGMCRFHKIFHGCITGPFVMVTDIILCMIILLWVDGSLALPRFGWFWRLQGLLRLFGKYSLHAVNPSSACYPENLARFLTTVLGMFLQRKQSYHFNLSSWVIARLCHPSCEKVVHYNRPAESQEASA